MNKNYTRFRVRIPFGNRKLQRQIYVMEGCPGIYFGYMTRYDKTTVKFVWNPKRYDYPWVFGVDKRASSCDVLKASIMAAILMFTSPQLGSGATAVADIAA